MKVTYGQMRDQNFARGMSKIANFAGFKSPKTAYAVAKLNQAILAEASTTDAVFKKLVMLHAKLDEKGELVPANGIPDTFEIRDEAMPAWRDGLKEFTEIEVELLNKAPIPLDQLEGIPLTPLEINALECLLQI